MSFLASMFGGGAQAPVATVPISPTNDDAAKQAQADAATAAQAESLANGRRSTIAGGSRGVLEARQANQARQTLG